MNRHFPEARITNNLFHYAPAIGILIFLGLFLFASTLYPGGSQVDFQSIGFDWVNNYWCNLMNSHGMNGQPNPAQPFAITAMVILCISLGVFFLQAAHTLPLSQTWKSITQYAGIVSMTLASFMFTSWHDPLTIASSIAGFFAVLGVLVGVAGSSLKLYKVSAVCCISLLLLNNYIYYTQHFILALPVIQKITFVFVLGWVLGLNTELVKIQRRIKIEKL